MTPGGDPLITINYKPLFPAKTNGWFFYKFNPWKPKFNQFLQRCLEAGLVKHYQDLTLQRAQSLYYQSDKEKNVVVERSSISPMTLEDLQVNFEMFLLRILTLIVYFLLNEFNLNFKGTLLPLLSDDDMCFDFFYI